MAKLAPDTLIVSTAADIANFEKTAFKDRGWASDTYSLLCNAAERFGPEPALTWIRDAQSLDDQVSWSFTDLLGEINRAANLFASLGCGPDDVIAFMLPNLPETHFVLWGAEATGVAFAINPALSSPMILSMLAATRAKVLIADTRVLSAEVIEGLNRELVDMAELTAVLAIEPERFALGSLPVHDLLSSLRRQQPERLAPRRINPAEVSSAFCTGGTTGSPKIALRSHGAEAADAHMLACVLGIQVGRGDSAFCGLPLFHVNATIVTGLASWINGVHVVLGPPTGYRDRNLIENFWRIVERFKLAAFSGVPTLYSTLLSIPIAGADISSLKVGLCGAAPMPSELFRKFEKATGIRILEGYGLTETVCTATLNPIHGRRHVGSVGYRLPYQDIRIVQIASDGTVARRCKVGEIGTIALAGPNIFSGYVDPVHNEGAWVNFKDDRKWLNSGDLGRVDKQGYFWLTGRKKELIIRGGHNIDPKIIEEAMHRHPDVAMAAAIGRPDVHAGEVPVVYVELHNGSSIGAPSLEAFAKNAVGERAAVPKEVVILERLPTTAVGKLFKPALAMMEIERAIRLEASAAGAQVTELDLKHVSNRGPTAKLTLSSQNHALVSNLAKYNFICEVVVQTSEKGATSESPAHPTCS